MPSAEVSIEVDPRTVDAERLARLKAMGFNRLSFGVQDFDPKCKGGAPHPAATRQVQALVGAARGAGFDSINVDLIYGLPQQTPVASAAPSSRSARCARPHRPVCYAHLPAALQAAAPHRGRVAAACGDKLTMLAGAISGFLGHAGYAYIGMDHFAKPTTALAIAKRQGRLHRNFQGYSAPARCDLIGLGVSSIAASAPPTARTPRPWTSTTTP